jgi:hypothetical protein
LSRGGTFTIAGCQPKNRIARWNASAWSAFGAGANSSAYSMLVLPNGDLKVGGAFRELDGAVSVDLG